MRSFGGLWHGDASAGERLFWGSWVFLLRAYMYTRWLSSPVVYSPSGLSPTGLSSHTLGL